MNGLLQSVRSAPRLGVLLLFVTFFSLYAFFAAPGITWSNAAADGAELATVVRTWGVAHPSGYPTYILFGKVFELVPIGDPAHRLALMSAFFGACAVSVTYLLGRLFCSLPEKGEVRYTSRTQGGGGFRLAGLSREFGPILGAVALGCSPIFWGQALVPEVYTLNAFFVTVVLWLLLSWLWEPNIHRTAPSRKPLFAAFLFGLGMGNHFTLAIAVVPVAAVVLWTKRRPMPLPWRSMAGALLLGLAVYLYLPIAAAQNPPINWGDASTASGFLWQVSGNPYRSYVFGVESSIVGDRVVDWFKQMVDQFQGIGVLLTLIGLWRLWRADRAVTGALALSFIVLSIYATFYLTADSYVFLIPSVVIGVLCIALGAQFLLRQAEALVQDTGRRIAADAVLASIAFLLVPGLSLIRFADEYSLRSDVAARNYPQHVFSQAPSDAVILGDGDQRLFTLWYQRYVEEPDSERIIVARNLLQFEWYRRTFGERHPELGLQELEGDFQTVLRGFVERNAGARPLYTLIDDPLLRGEFTLQLEGPAYRILPKAAPN